MGQTQQNSAFAGELTPIQRVLAAQPLKIEPDAYYPEHDVAALLGVSPETVRRRRQTKSDLAFSRFGRRVFYRGADIIAFLASSRRMSTSDTGPRRAASR